MSLPTPRRGAVSRSYVTPGESIITERNLSSTPSSTPVFHSHSLFPSGVLGVEKREWSLKSGRGSGSGRVLGAEESWEWKRGSGVLRERERVEESWEWKREWEWKSLGGGKEGVES
jgi:hypothetical protein